MKIHRLWVDDRGESHFQDVEVPLEESSSAKYPPITISTGIRRHADSTS